AQTRGRQPPKHAPAGSIVRPSGLVSRSGSSFVLSPPDSWKTSKFSRHASGYPQQTEAAHRPVTGLDRSARGIRSHQRGDRLKVVGVRKKVESAQACQLETVALEHGHI